MLQAAANTPSHVEHNHR